MREVKAFILIFISSLYLFSQRGGMQVRFWVGAAPGGLPAKGGQNIASYTPSYFGVGIAIDQETRDVIYSSFKKNLFEKAFNQLYKLLQSNYKSVICTNYSCRRLLPYIKFYLAYKKFGKQVTLTNPDGSLRTLIKPNFKVYNDFIKYLKKQPEEYLIEKIATSDLSEKVDLHTLVKLIMINPYSIHLEKLLGLFIQQAIEVGDLTLVEQVLQYLYSLRIKRIKVVVKNVAGYLKVLKKMYTSNRKLAQVEKEEAGGNPDFVEIFRTGRIFNKDKVCKEQQQNINFGKLYRVFEYPHQGDPSSLHTEGQECINLPTFTSYPSSYYPYGQTGCSDILFFLYKGTALGFITNPVFGALYAFKSQRQASNMLMRLPPHTSEPSSENKNPNVLMWGPQSSEEKFASFSKVLFTKKYIVYSGSTPQTTTVCKIDKNLDLLTYVRDYFTSTCYQFFNLNLNYEKLYILQVNVDDNSDTLYILFLIESQDHYKLSLFAFSALTLSLKWDTNFVYYPKPKETGGWRGAWAPQGPYQVNIPKHSITFTPDGDIVILSKFYLIVLDRLTGIFTYYQPLPSNELPTSFTEPLIIKKNEREIIYFPPDSSFMHQIDIEQKKLVKFLDISEGNSSGKTLFVPGISKNLLIYYLYANPRYGGQGQSENAIKGVDLKKLEIVQDAKIPVDMLASYGDISFLSMDCNYIYYATPNGIVKFTTDLRRWKIDTGDDNNIRLLKIRFKSSDPEGWFEETDLTSAEINPIYVFSYDKFLLVFTKNTMYVLSSSLAKKKSK
jgi:hypothetical protein